MPPYDLAPLLSAAEIRRRVADLAKAVAADYPDQPGRPPLWLIIALRGAVFFGADLARALGRDVSLDFVRAASYGTATDSSGEVRVLRAPDADLAGVDVVLVEDIVDSGRTANVLLKLLADRRPNSLRLAALLDKPTRRVEPVAINYKGFEIPDRFVVGYGLDYAERHRALGDIRTVEFR